MLAHSDPISRQKADSLPLKHKPVYLLAYEALTGAYVDESDCKYLSLGWAQSDQRSASLKKLRHTVRNGVGRAKRSRCIAPWI